MLRRKKTNGVAPPIRGTVLKNNGNRMSAQEGGLNRVNVNVPVVLIPKYRYISIIISISLILMFLGCLIIMRTNFQAPPDMADREEWSRWESEVRMWNYWGRVSVGFGALILGMAGAYGITRVGEEYRLRVIYSTMVAVAALIMGMLLLSIPYPI